MQIVIAFGPRPEKPPTTAIVIAIGPILIVGGDSKSLHMNIPGKRLLFRENFTPLRLFPRSSKKH
jgi:hypothetical protein